MSGGGRAAAGLFRFRVTILKTSPEADSPAAALAPALPFVLASSRRLLVADGAARVVPSVPAHDLVPHLQRLVDADAAPSSLVVGALPFDHARPAHLFVPSTVVRIDEPTTAERFRHLPPASDEHVAAALTLSPEPPAAVYAANVGRILKRIGTPARPGQLSKVVLARSLALTSTRVIDTARVIRRLAADASVTTFCVPLPPARGTRRAIVGATPELLLSKTGGRVASTPLAGSARRAADPSVDRDRIHELLRSSKDRREHAAVVEWIADRLSPFCADLTVPDEPEPVSTDSMWHLGTRISGALRDEATSSVELALAIHPTPAVCGLPVADAAAAIAELEPFDRGFFAGAVGWCQADGDGEWLVSIRCAELDEHHARLYAGAGIVAGSDPAAELDETSAKFLALLRALGVDESGQPIAGSGV